MTTPHRLAIGGHHRPREGLSNDWLTPPEILEALGPFDLDPCASTNQPWPTAKRHITADENGLTANWGDAFVWLNPPYGPHSWRWLERLAEHPPGGIALIFARTETLGFERQVWRRAEALLFLFGRLHFHNPDGTRAAANSGAPSVLVAYGKEARRRLYQARLAGAFVADWRI